MIGVDLLPLVYPLHRIRDSTPVPALLEQTDHRVASLCADGTYDSKSVYEAAQRKGHG